MDASFGYPDNLDARLADIDRLLGSDPAEADRRAAKVSGLTKNAHTARTCGRLVVRQGQTCDNNRSQNQFQAGNGYIKGVLIKHPAMSLQPHFNVAKMRQSCKTGTIAVTPVVWAV